jgi:signal transduction histidine kinase/sensor domain CHASE-containing protein/ActR/RegA family two-component response regulator
MKLRKKTFLLTTLSLALVTTVMLAVFRFVALRSFDRMEEAEATRAMQRVKRLVQVELDDMGRWALDYGACAELGRVFEKGEVDALVRASISREALPNLRWSCFALIRNDRQVLAAGAISAEQTLQPLPHALIEELVAVTATSEPSAALQGSQRLALLGGQPYMVVEAPIRLQAEDGKIMGRLIAARCFDQRELERLSHIADLPVTFLPPGGNSIGARGGSGNQAGAIGKVFMTYERPGQVTANEIISGPSGQTVGILQVTLDRKIREEGLWFTLILMGVVVVGEVLVYFLIDWLFLRQLIARLARLGTSLSEVHRSGNLGARMGDSGDDEIAALVYEINHLLMSVEQAQRTLERTNAEMQQRVAERTTALAAANAALEADIDERIKAEQEREGLREQLIRSSKMEAVGTLAGGIAHDFNNILAGILGHVQLVDSDLPSNHPSRANLRQVIAACERAVTLVHQILSFSRQTPGERRRVSVGKIAREALSLLRAALPSTISIKCEVEAAVDIVEADPTQLHQVFMNLGANAGHAMGSQAGELTIEIASFQPGGMRPGFTNPPPAGDYLCIEVSDTGCGMSREVIERIFDPFFSTKPVNEGTGLGLAVVHGIVTDHGGTIQVESEPGKGTVFRILLPAAASSTASSASYHALPLRGSERVLLVDDEELVLGALSQGLERLGYAVTVESSSLAALDRFKKAPEAFDLVITDQTMPQMSGLELSKAIHAVRPAIPIIIITGFSPQLNGKSAQSLGVAGILGKPIDFGELSTLMRTELNAARGQTS